MTADRPATEPQTWERLAAPLTCTCHVRVPNCAIHRLSDGAAPRAEGLDEAVNMLRRIVAVRGRALLLQDEIEGAKNWLARLSRPSDERIPESEN